MSAAKKTERDCGYTAQGSTLHLVGMAAVSGLRARARCGRDLRETLRAVWQGRGAPLTCTGCVKADTGVDPGESNAAAKVRDAAPDLLAACTKVLANLDAALRGNRPVHNDLALANELRAAIAKATT